MSLYVLLVCALLIVLLSVIHQWKLLVLLALLFAGTAFTLLWYSTLNKGDTAEKEIESIHILYGIEKRSLLKDPEFQELLREKHGIVINDTKSESLRLPEEMPEGIDGLWPSTATAAMLFRQQHPDLQYKTHNIFNTPLVLYSWADVTDALIRQRVVRKRGNLYIADLGKLIMMGDRTWESMRLERQEGLMIIRAADPGKSNAGFLMAGLAAIALNHGNTPDQKEIEQYLPVIREMYKRMGDSERSADTLFNNYIRQGQGAFPLISACENQVIKLYQTRPAYQDKIRRLVRVIIPEPTVLSDHPFIALTEKGEKLLTALQDPDILKFAWQKYGFRSNTPEIESETEPDIENAPGFLKMIGLARQVKSVNLPPPEVMGGILKTLGKTY